jgi:hypothetical protein
MLLLLSYEVLFALPPLAVLVELLPPRYFYFRFLIISEAVVSSDTI